MWREMGKGWVDLAVELYGLLWRFALVSGVALATYTMITRGTSG